VRRRLTLLLCLLLLTPWLSLGTERVAALSPAPVPVLLVHGFGGSASTTWRAAIPRFEAEGYRPGRDLFVVDLATRITEEPLDLFADLSQVRAAIEELRQQTGWEQIDLVGHSRGGLIVRTLAAGESARYIRRAVAIATPHTGILADEVIASLLQEAGLPPFVRALLPIPPQLEAGSPALRTIQAREERFPDQRAAALTIGVTWREGAPAVLQGNDGIVPLQSQLAWPGAKALTFRLGPPAEALVPPVDPLVIAAQSPHLEAPRSPAVLQAVLDFLQAPEAGPAGEAAQGSGSGAGAPEWLAELQVRGDQPMTRAEFVYPLVRLSGLPERLQPTPFSDLAGHWALGYAEAARQAGLASGVSPQAFAPDRVLIRAEAVVLIARALGLAPSPQPSRFADTRGHWAEGWIEAAAGRGLVQGDSRGFRPDDPVLRGEGALILARSLGGG